MHSRKSTKTGRTRATPLPAIDRDHEEGILFQRWAASDGQRIIDDLDFDDPSDEKLFEPLAKPRSGSDHLDT